MSRRRLLSPRLTHAIVEDDARLGMAIHEITRTSPVMKAHSRSERKRQDAVRRTVADDQRAAVIALDDAHVDRVAELALLLVRWAFEKAVDSASSPGRSPQDDRDAFLDLGGRRVVLPGHLHRGRADTLHVAEQLARRDAEPLCDGGDGREAGVALVGLNGRKEMGREPRLLTQVFEREPLGSTTAPDFATKRHARESGRERAVGTFPMVYVTCTMQQVRRSSRSVGIG